MCGAREWLGRRAVLFTAAATVVAALASLIALRFGRTRQPAAVPYDVDLAERLRELLGPEVGVSEKKMFGGVAFFLAGHMAVCASSQGGLMVRVGAAEFDKLLSRAGVEAVEMRGRPMTGWIRVNLEHLKTTKQLQSWVDRGVACAQALPPKK